MPIDEAQVGKLMKLIEALEDNYDVDAVHANFDVPAECLNRLPVGRLPQYQLRAAEIRHVRRVRNTA